MLIWRVTQTHALYENGIVGKGIRELCQMCPFVVVRQGTESALTALLCIVLKYIESKFHS